MEMHGELLVLPPGYKQDFELTQMIKCPEFDKETFGIMSDMIKQDPNVPMMFAKQTEYREDVSHAACSWPPKKLTSLIESSAST